jgi:hypothetical protein
MHNLASTYWIQGRGRNTLNQAVLSVGHALGNQNPYTRQFQQQLERIKPARQQDHHRLVHFKTMAAQLLDNLRVMVAMTSFTMFLFFFIPGTIGYIAFLCML